MQIKEFLPNPVGSDKEGEYIKIFNDGNEAVILNGWQLKDASGKAYSLSGTLNGKSEMVLPYSQTKITLNNNGEQIFLYNGVSNLIDQLGYSGTASEGQIINRETSKMAKGEMRQEIIGGAINEQIYYQSIMARIVFLDFLTAGILAGLILYLMLRIEENLEIKLF